MSEEALNGAAEAAPAEPVAPALEPEAPPAPKSARSAVADALATVQSQDTQTPVTEPQNGSEQARGPDGKFVSKEPEPPKAPDAAPADEAPARFSADAKEAWSQAPEPIRAEIRRAISEMEKGLEGYQAQMEPLKRFDEMAKAGGTTVADALEKYVGFEQLARQDPVRGLAAIAQNLGYSLEDIARHVLGQAAPEAEQDPRDAQIAQLTQTVQQLQQQVGGVTQNMQTQTAGQQIEAFKAQPGHERFDELQDEMAQMIRTGYATDLADAYEKAARQLPAPAPAVVPPPAPAPQTQPVSIMGAPASGSNPATKRQPSPNARSAVKRALAQANGQL